MHSLAHLHGVNDAIDSAKFSNFWKVWNKYKHGGDHLDVSSLNENNFSTNFMNNFIYSNDNSVIVDEFLNKYMKYNAHKLVLSVTVLDVLKACF